jgi:CheY-like chemotaxis protein
VLKKTVVACDLLGARRASADEGHRAHGQQMMVVGAAITHPRAAVDPSEPQFGAAPEAESNLEQIPRKLRQRGFAGEREQTVAAGRAGSRRVLVVDDEIAIRETIADVLQDAGYVVEQASHGSEGLAMLRRSRPDVVVLDLMMPIMDGWSFARACNALSDGQAVPIVIMSAGSDLQRSAKQLRPHGVRAALAKPFDVEVLLAAVGRLAAGR